jgi:Uncharacterized phage-associated protein
MADVFDVAKYILNKASGESISTFKLQKLVYYSQAWSLVWDDTPLFKNKIYAWANGPVCRDLYELHKGLFSIAASDFGYGDPTKLIEPAKATIDLVLQSYAPFNGQQLSNLTHTETPWMDARKGIPIGERGEREITLDSMVEYYSAKYAEQTANINGTP